MKLIKFKTDSHLVSSNLSSVSFVLGLGLLGLGLALSACGSNTPPNSNSLYTNYSMPNPFNNPWGTNTYNTNTTPTNCIPLTGQPIGFQGKGISMNNDYLFAGAIPAGDPLQSRGAVAGQVILTQNAASVNGTYHPQQNSTSTQDGEVELDFMPDSNTQGQLGVVSGTSSGVGSVILSTNKLRAIYASFGINYDNFITPGALAPSSQTPIPQVCGVALSLKLYGTVVTGRAYLYLNGTVHGTYLQFN